MNCVTIVKIAQSSENCLTWVTLYLLGLFRYISKFKIKKIEIFRGMTDIPVISIVYKSKLVNHFCKIIIISKTNSPYDAHPSSTKGESITLNTCCIGKLQTACRLLKTIPKFI